MRLVDSYKDAMTQSKDAALSVGAASQESRGSAPIYRESSFQDGTIGLSAEGGSSLREPLFRRGAEPNALILDGFLPPNLLDRADAISNSRLKRAIDVAGAAGGLLFLSPLLLLVAGLIRLESPGPVLFRQKRTGYLGRTFTIYKFRTMCVEEDGDVIVQACRNDSRTTRIGNFLRRTSIDELPQLLNVLKGQMSLVGPRPHAVAHDIYYASYIPEYQARFLTRPGLSGLAQVSGLRGATPTIRSMAKRVDADLTYISEWSWGMELKILARTVLIALVDKRAY
jgi:putative colanic acid biosynthesis UDP-glucose lipid carrier transferase